VKAGLTNEALTKKSGPAGRRRTPLKLARILVPVDLSEWSGRAVDYALDLASQFGGEVILLHILEPLAYPGNGVIPLSAAGELRAEKEEIRAILASYTAGSNVHARFLVQTGRAWVEICKVARDERCDLLVLCKHGATGITKALMGSVADKVIHHAPCAVLALKPRGRRVR
jgi:universal stress protein A